MQIEATLRRSFFLLLGLLALILASGCSGGASSTGGQLDGGSSAKTASPAPLAGIANLPAPSEIQRNASVIESGLVCNGATFRDDLTHQNVSRSGESCLFDPSFTGGSNPLYSQVALAIYSFDVSSLSAADLSVVDLDVDGLPDLVIGTVHVYAGIPGVTLDKWDWSELKKKPGTALPQIESWSWGESNPGRLADRATQGVLNVCLVVFGDTALDVSRVALDLPSSAPASPPVLQELFRKGNWDLATNKGGRLSSLGLDVDSNDCVHATCFDTSNSQLYYFQAQGRQVRQMALDCDAPVGSSNSVCVSPQGGVLSVYTDDSLHQGCVRWMAPESISSLTWSPRSNFDKGDDGSGTLSQVGAQCRCIFDDKGTAHVFYLDSTTHDLRHASLLNGLPPGTPWTVEVVSPPDQVASCPAPIRCPDGACVAYISKVGAAGAGQTRRLMLATQDAAGTWSSRVLATNVHVPDGIDDEDCDGFCDGSVRPGTNEVAIAYSSPNGFSVVHYDLSSSSVRLRESPTRQSSRGAFVRCAAMGDGSVRVCDYDTAARTIFFEDGDVPAGQDFVSLPAVQYGADEDCDDLDFWVDPNTSASSLHQVVLVELSTSVTALGSSKKEFKGHVTLLK
jgi:hypothetical protein